MALELDQSSFWDDENDNGVIDPGETVYYDLTTQTGSEALVNGAIFTTSDLQSSSGTGLIQAFVRVQDGGNGPGDGFESGYNTSERPLSYEENTSPSFTKTLLLNQVPIVTIDGQQYYEFRLDINQLNSNPLLSLDAVKLFTSDVSDGELSGLITDSTFTVASLQQVYDLDTNLFGADDDFDGMVDPSQDNSILLDYSLQAGSGRTDMFFYVLVDQVLDPDGDGVNVNPDETYITLYSEFGSVGTLGDDENIVAADDSQFNSLDYTNNEADDFALAIEGEYSTNDGFEEWSVSKQFELSISGYKWEDLNGDGVWDPTENGLADWQMYYSYSVKIKGVDIVITGVVETADGSTDDLDGDGVIDQAGFYVIPLDFTDKNYDVTIIETAPGIDVDTNLGDIDGWLNTFAGDGTADGEIVFSYNKNFTP